MASKGYYINATYSANDMQQSFKVDKPFNTDTISVFLNGKLMELGTDADYVAIPDTGRIAFNTPLLEGDKVSIVTTAQDGNLSLDVVSRNGSTRRKGLFQKYGDVAKLKYNNEYEANFVICGKVVNWKFETKRTPFFANVKDIFMDIGEFIEGYTEKQVSDVIYSNSVQVVELIDDLMNKDIQNVSYTVIDDTYDSSYRAVKNWVKYKTEIDLIYSRYFGISLNYGSIKKEIGDIKVEKSTKLPYLDNLLSRLKGWWDEADQEIRGTNSVAAFIKAGDKYKYESWERKTLFNE